VAAAPPTPWLVAATDLGLLAGLWLVPLCLGGRLAIGQGVLIVAAVWATACWSLHQLTNRDCRWIWTRCEWLWLAAMGLVGLQLMELPEDWLEWLSPLHAEVLSEWPESAIAGVYGKRWATISLAPHETRSSLATFLAYGLLFVIAVQRCREQADIERIVKWIATATIVIAVFSLMQYFFSNGKFYGVLQHPFSDPRRYNLGPFTNRNHLAQFLALGVGPLLWWWLKTCRGNTEDNASRIGNTAPLHGAFIVALGTVVIAILLTQSRGGVLALGMTGIVSLCGLQRARWISGQFVLALVTALVIIGGIGYVAGSQELARRIDETGNESRWEIWQANIEVAKHFPWIGTGVGTHVNSHQLYLDRAYTNREYTHADNSYLQVASECGMAGISIAGLMIVTCCGWIWGIMRRATDPATTAIAAVLLGSFAGHIAHAVFDFLWYVPGLMVVVLLLAAAARRLSQLDLVACGRTTPELPLARLGWALACVGVFTIAPWMWSQKSEAIAAEPHRLRYLDLVFVPWTVFPVDDQPETQIALTKEKATCAIRAAKADPHDGQLQLTAALAYRQMFDVRQEESDNPMTLAQLRDAVRASGFTSREEIRDWMSRAAGKNARLLEAAWACDLRSIQHTPLEGLAYVSMSELSFLHDPSGELQQRLVKQALAVRPYDPHVLFAAGQEALLLDQEEESLAHWKRAFKYGPLFQKRIADILVIDKSAEFIQQTFNPDWEAQARICESFRAVGREDELEVMLRYYANSAVKFARQQSEEDLAAPAWLAARTALTELEQPERAIAVLREAAKRHPHCLQVRTALGVDLFHQEQYEEAANHLRWAAGRKPDDDALQNIAKQAIRASLKGDRVSPAGFEL